MTDSGSPRLNGEIETDDPLGRHLNRTSPDVFGWAIRTGRIPFAVKVSDEEWPAENSGELHSYAGGIAWAVHNVGDEWDSVACTAGVGAYRLRLHVDPIDEGLSPWGDEEVPPLPTSPAITVENVTIEQLATGTVAAWVFRIDLIELLRAVHHDSQAAHVQLGAAISDALQQSGIEVASCLRLQGSWNLTRATFTAKMGSAPTHQADLPDPWKLDSAFSAEAQRLLAVRLKGAGVEPGLFVGDRLKDLDNAVLAPAALALLEERLADFNMRDVCLTGLEQINRCIAASASIARNIEQSALEIDLQWDPIERLRETERDYVNLRMANEACVEAAIRMGSSGTGSLDRVAWQHLIAAAYHYIEATNRSEGIHHQVTPQAVRITDYFEIEVSQADMDDDQRQSDQRVYDLDIEAFQRARAEHRMGPIGPLTEEAGLDDVGLTDGRESGEHPDVELALRQIDAGMLQSYGCTATDIVVTLQSMALWPMQTRSPSVAMVSSEQIVEHVLESLLSVDDDHGERIAQAVTMLTSTASGLQAADWRPWQVRTRRDRLLVRPLVEISENEIAIAPHYCHGSANAYLNHLTQGMLPWSSPAPPKELDRALADYRDERNKALERQVTAILSSAGYSVRARVKPQDAKSIGLDKLEGEVDDVAGRAEADVLWLLEVKDPADALVASDIRRSLDRFYVGKGKRSYVEMLSAKANDIEARIDAVAAALGLPALDGGRSRKLRTIFVTRSPNTAGFVGGEFPFVTAKGLISYMRAVERDSVVEARSDD